MGIRNYPIWAQPSWVGCSQLVCKFQTCPPLTLSSTWFSGTSTKFSTEIESFEYKGMESNCERQSGFCCLCLMRKVNICVRWQQRRLRMYFITSWRGEEKLTLAALKFLRVLHAVDNGKYSPHLGCQAERKRGSKDQLRLHSPVYC